MKKILIPCVMIIYTMSVVSCDDTIGAVIPKKSRSKLQQCVSKTQNTLERGGGILYSAIKLDPKNITDSALKHIKKKRKQSSTPISGGISATKSGEAIDWKGLTTDEQKKIQEYKKATELTVPTQGTLSKKNEGILLHAQNLTKIIFQASNIQQLARALNNIIGTKANIDLGSVSSIYLQKDVYKSYNKHNPGTIHNLFRNAQYYDVDTKSLINTNVANANQNTSGGGVAKNNQKAPVSKSSTSGGKALDKRKPSVAQPSSRSAQCR